MNKFTAQKRISVLWFAFSGVIGAILIFMTLSEKFGEQAADVWKWYSILVVPSLMLIITTFLASLKQQTPVPEVDKFFFSLSFGMSLFYLLILLGIVLFVPYADGAVAMFNNSVTYLALFQGLVTASLGLFFTK